MPPSTFKNRDDAAHQLVTALSRYRGTHPLILAIPRGGVPIGRIVADALGGELDVVLVRKLRAPHQPEFAIGAIDERGNAQFSDDAARAGVDSRYARQEADHQLDVIRARRELYSPHRTGADPRNRTVIVIDDGLATGATMRAALAATRVQGPARLVCAVPVAAPASLVEVESLADEVICLAAPASFRAVGQFYADFSSVEDDEVVRLLDARPRDRAALRGR